MERQYIAVANYGGGFGNGYGGTYMCEFEFASSHRANSRANKSDAKMAWKRSHKGWVEIIETRLCQCY